MNPLLFMPSPRDIPEVKKTWHIIPYDKFIVKYTPEVEAYQIGRNFFLEHEEYTHFIICPDDLEISTQGVEQLMDDADEFDFPVISGIGNIDESQPDLLAICRKPCQYNLGPSVGYGEYIKRDELPKDDIFEVGHLGFGCQIIDRDTIEKTTFQQWEDKGYLDWQFSIECNKLGIQLLVDKRVSGYHRRFQQRLKKEFKDKMTDMSLSYTIWLRDR